MHNNVSEEPISDSPDAEPSFDSMSDHEIVSAILEVAEKDLFEVRKEYAQRNILENVDTPQSTRDQR